MNTFLGLIVGYTWVGLGIWGWSRILDRTWAGTYRDLLVMEGCIITGPIALLVSFVVT